MTVPSSVRNSLLKTLCGAALCFGMSAAQAQELNCTVSVIAPQVSNVDASRFEALEDGIREFMNGRRWTEDNFEFEERIECTLQITINEAIGSTVFKEAAKSRVPVRCSTPITTPRCFWSTTGTFNSSGSTTATSCSTVDTSRQLVPLLAYYAYMMIGMDYDTFSLEGERLTSSSPGNRGQRAKCWRARLAGVKASKTGTG